MSRFALALSLLLVPSLAAAQLGYVSGDSGAISCVAGTPCSTDTSCEPTERCHVLGAATRFCAPDDALYCDRFGGLTEPCPSGMHYLAPTVLPSLLSGLEICVPDFVDTLCGDGASCFTSSDPAVTRLVSFAAGDCDRDGLSNLDDPRPCQIPAPIGLINPSTGRCITTNQTGVCVSDVDCPSAAPFCVDVPGEDHKYCAPNDRPGLCCGGVEELGCPNDVSCEVDADGEHGLCHEYCDEDGWSYEDRLGCIIDRALEPTDPDYFVPADLGDCDDDGVPNGVEASAEGRDPCVVEEEPFDGGVPPGDEDAGGIGRADGGGTDPFMDASAGPPTQASFTGGGGCRCRAAPSRGGAAVMAWLGLAFGLLALRRRQPR